MGGMSLAGAPRKYVPERVGFLYRALRHRNYRLFFSGQIVSLIGTWLTMVATSWLVYRLCRETMPGKAALILGLVGFAGQLPVFLLTPVAGVWIDRMNRHRILIFTQSLSMVQSFTLAYLALTHQITIPQIIALSIFQGLLNDIDMPARQAFVIEIVENRNDLGNAIALNSSMVHTARLLGPSVAGFLIYHFGEGYCFLIDGISYFAVILALLAMKVSARAKTVHLPPLKELQDGIHYAAKSPSIRALLLMVAVVSLMFMSQSVLMPIVADKILGGNERTLGFLLGASGLGALLGSLYLASRESVLGLGRVILYSTIVLGCGLVAFAFSTVFPVSLGLLGLMGCATVLLMASCNTILQTIVDDDKRGRIMSLFSFAFMGMAPFGSLLAGGLANRFSAPVAFAVCGGICLIAAALFNRELPDIREHIRPIYRKKGILPMVEPE